jgi:sodium/potassium-transporting ATPase subunit beta
MKTVWLSCEGETPTDVENVGTIQYVPQPGFPGYYFPYNNTENYVSPMVAIYKKKKKSKFVCVILNTNHKFHIG